MAYSATWFNRTDLPGGSTIVEIQLTDNAGIRPTIRMERCYPTSLISVAFRNSEAIAIIMRLVASQNAEFVARQRAVTARVQNDLNQALRAAAETLITDVSTAIANSMTTPATPQWNAAFSAATQIGRQKMIEFVSNAIDAANDAAG